MIKLLNTFHSSLVVQIMYSFCDACSHVWVILEKVDCSLDRISTTSVHI